MSFGAFSISEIVPNDHKVVKELNSVQSCNSAKFLPYFRHGEAHTYDPGGSAELSHAGGLHMTALSTGGLGIRRRDLPTTRWYFYCPNSLLVRFEKLITSRATHKAVYGLRSSILTECLQSWLDGPEKESYAARARGWKRPKHDAHDNNTRISVYLPRDLADRIALNFTNSSGGPLFGFQTFLLINLIKKWVEEREAQLQKGFSYDLAN